MRAINKGKLHIPKYHRANRPIRLTEADIDRLLALKERMKAQDDDWLFPNCIKKGKIMKPGPIWHETLLARRIRPVAERCSLSRLIASPEIWTASLTVVERISSMRSATSLRKAGIDHFVAP